MLKITPHSRLARVLALLTAITVALPPSLPLAASPAMEKLFYILKQKGSITADEYDLLVQTMREEDKAEKSRASAPAASGGSSPALSGSQEQRIARMESRMSDLSSTVVQAKSQIEEISKVSDNTSPSTLSVADLDALLSDKWYQRLSVKGYLQFRGANVLNQDGTLNVFNDPFAADTQTFGIRRGRLTLSGDVTNHVYLYMQMDFFGSVGGATNNNTTNSAVLSARDYYADISLDPGREFRVRLGLSKVPYGFANLQSSQNRLALERADAINSAVEGERDYGAFFYWAPYHIRNRFKDLVKMGLRGSGDYGVIALGAYNGQGINARSDTNGHAHYVARVTWPFELPNGQFFEIGASGYSGRFMPNTTGATTFARGGVRDERVGVHAILYPQPFGLEAEWNWGRGPELDPITNVVKSQSLQGGYLQASYRHVFASQQELIPFVRWQTYEGGRKFANNAPRMSTEELGLGLRYIPYPELELSLMYNTGKRTNTTAAPFPDVKYSYLGLQAQINF